MPRDSFNYQRAPFAIKKPLDETPICKRALPDAKGLFHMQKSSYRCKRAPTDIKGPPINEKPKSPSKYQAALSNEAPLDIKVPHKLRAYRPNGLSNYQRAPYKQIAYNSKRPLYSLKSLI